MIDPASHAHTCCATPQQLAQSEPRGLYWRSVRTCAAPPACIVSVLTDVAGGRLIGVERSAMRFIKGEPNIPDEKVVLIRSLRSRHRMHCPNCDHDDSLALSRSKDRWVWRLLLHRMVRCHWCHNRFLAPVWQRLPQIGLDMLSRSIIAIDEHHSPNTSELDAA